MVKSNNTLTKFDGEEVTSAQMDLVRAHINAWLPKARTRFGDKPSINLKIVHDFLKFLTTKDKSFKVVQISYLKTT